MYSGKELYHVFLLGSLSGLLIWCLSLPQELFSPFGQISRIYIAYDRDTGESRGFAFVNFLHKDDAARAVEKLDGHGYDNLILRVEFAAPREERR